MHTILKAPLTSLFFHFCFQYKSNQKVDTHTTGTGKNRQKHMRIIISVCLCVSRLHFIIIIYAWQVYAVERAGKTGEQLIIWRIFFCCARKKSWKMLGLKFCSSQLWNELSYPSKQQLIQLIPFKISTRATTHKILHNFNPFIIIIFCSLASNVHYYLWELSHILKSFRYIYPSLTCLVY